MAFSSVSPTLAIFCLVAPNVPLCLSAVTTQLIYIYLHIQKAAAQNYIYLIEQKSYFNSNLFEMYSGGRPHLCARLSRGGNVGFTDAAYILSDIWSEVRLEKYDKCLWEDNQCSVNSITLATDC